MKPGVAADQQSLPIVRQEHGHGLGRSFAIVAGGMKKEQIDFFGRQLGVATVCRLQHEVRGLDAAQQDLAIAKVNPHRAVNAAAAEHGHVGQRQRDLAQRGCDRNRSAADGSTQAHLLVLHEDVIFAPLDVESRRQFQHRLQERPHRAARRLVPQVDDRLDHAVR